jgi:C1A family cysteine protease
MLESDYPYTPTADVCEYDATKGQLNVVSYKQITGTTTAMKDAVWRQPCAVAISAGTRTFQTYKSGIITTKSCGITLNHAVTVVGYGSTFWIVKNSWGTSWGE